MEEILIEPIMYMDQPVFDVSNTLDFFVRFILNMICVGTIVRWFYYPKSHRRDYFFTFMIISVSIFMLVYYMEGSKLKTGAALGLFAIFGIIRYRTESVPIREMTYLFFLVALSVINGMADKISILELLIPNILFILVAWIFESTRMIKHRPSKYINYDNISLITPDKREELIADLERRTGLKVVHVEIGTIDFLRDSALLRIYYESDKDKGNTMESVDRLPKVVE